MTAFVACCVALGPRARAQAFDQFIPTFVPGYDSERDADIPNRPRTEYDPLGVRLGDFTVLPEIDETLAYDSNPLGARAPVGSFVVGTAPRIDFSNQSLSEAPSGVSIGGDLGLSNESYLRLPRQSFTDFHGSVGASYDLGVNPITVSASEVRQHELSTDINSASATRPIGYDVTDLRLRDETTQGFVRLQPNFDYTGYRFDNLLLPGDTLSQTARDRNIFGGGVTAHIGNIPERSLVVVLHADGSHYISDLGGAPRPDSVAYEVLVGSNYAVSGNLKILLLGGYEVRRFSAAAYAQQASPVADGAIVWTPSGLTTLSLTAYRTIQDSIGETFTGVTESKAQLTLDQEYLRNVLLQARASIDNADFGQRYGTQTLYGLGASVTWLLNRNLRVIGSYDYTASRGSTNAPSLTGSDTIDEVTDSNVYDRNLAQLTVRVVF